MPEYREPPKGWWTFGSFVDDPRPVTFSTEKGEDGFPLWERPVIQHDLWCQADPDRDPYYGCACGAVPVKGPGQF